MSTPKPVLPTRHRTWNHNCLTYAAGEGRFFYNGQLLATLRFGKGGQYPRPGGRGGQQALGLGQEPRRGLRDGFDVGKLLRGNITHLNMWSRVLETSEIEAMAACEDFSLGDVVAWREGAVKMNGEAGKQAVDDLRLMCKKDPLHVMFAKVRMTIKLGTYADFYILESCS